MSDSLLSTPPSHDRGAFGTGIASILAGNWPTCVALAPGGPAITGWKREPDARLVLILAGEQRYAWRDGAHTTERRCQSGEAIWFAPGAPMREHWDKPVRFLGIVLRPHFLRFLVGVGPGTGHHPGTSPWSHHTAEALGEPGTLIARALDRLAEGRGDPAAGGELLRALLRCCRDHAERCAATPPGKAAATWQRVQEWIALNSHTEVDRGHAASALGLNATYLSDLCRRQAGTGFARVVEAERLTRARLLLRSEPGLAVAEIARRCGFTSAGYFARVFRRATGSSPIAWRSGSA